MTRTRSAILLLGNAEAGHLVQPASPILRWILKDAKGVERDYELFSLPLLLAVDKVFAKIRILKIRYMRRGTIFPVEVDQYDAYSIRESINNAISHQDYTLGGRINVVEFDDRLVFGNVGSFMPGDVRRVVIEDAPQEVYRNERLVQAMFNLKMVDTVGGGIRKMFIAQTKRSFPLPDYRLSDNRVEVTFPGKILDMKYTELLLAKQDELSLEEIMLLDKLQKGHPITDDEAKSLRSKKLIEGRKPNYFVAKSVAQLTGQKAEYSKNTAFEKQHYLDLICKAIDEHGSMSRTDIDLLIWPILPGWMDESQRKNRIDLLLRQLRESGQIDSERRGPRSEWRRPSGDAKKTRRTDED